MSTVTPTGRVGRLKTYAMGALMLLGGPGFLALGLLLHAHLWAVILIAAVLSSILTPLAVAMCRDVRRDQRRLAERSRAGS